MSLCEWLAALEGLAPSKGVASRTQFPRKEDFDHLAHRMGPTPSIRAK